ncbi:uncharacterized protein V2V93DRAFT_375965 [Kockiozyma suomiensis]|uniref:uncharacterized protein n=1 Tax=Kockiozyma suomiensis TaxID=1337062 RepID=UPI003343CE90
MAEILQKTAEISTSSKNLGLRKNGKQWKEIKEPKRINGLGTRTAWDQREKKRNELAVLKAEQKRLQEEKQEATKSRIDRIKQKRQDKEDKERYARLSEKMHKKRVERLKRREKRNKLLKDR